MPSLTYIHSPSPNYREAIVLCNRYCAFLCGMNLPRIFWSKPAKKRVWTNLLRIAWSKIAKERLDKYNSHRRFWLHYGLPPLTVPLLSLLMLPVLQPLTVLCTSVIPSFSAIAVLPSVCVLFVVVELHSYHALTCTILFRDNCFAIVLCNQHRAIELRNRCSHQIALTRPARIWNTDRIRSSRQPVGSPQEPAGPRGAKTETRGLCLKNA